MAASEEDGFFARGDESRHCAPGTRAGSLLRLPRGVVEIAIKDEVVLEDGPDEFDGEGDSSSRGVSTAM